jgi:hypothetical protein
MKLTHAPHITFDFNPDTAAGAASCGNCHKGMISNTFSRLAFVLDASRFARRHAACGRKPSQLLEAEEAAIRATAVIDRYIPTAEHRALLRERWTPDRRAAHSQSLRDRHAARTRQMLAEALGPEGAN